MSDIIDARGLSCPQPVIMIQRAVADKPQSCVIIVDNKPSVENITRFAKFSHYNITIEEQNGEYTLTLKIKDD